MLYNALDFFGVSVLKKGNWEERKEIGRVLRCTKEIPFNKPGGTVAEGTVFLVHLLLKGFGCF